MKVADLIRCMESIAPARYAAPWDNVGLLVGDEASTLERVLLAVDCSAAVLDEARSARADAIVAYHPVIFAEQKRFVAGSIAYGAARAGIAIHSPHTSLDVAAGGTNDVLADAIAMTTRRALRPLCAKSAEKPAAKPESVKLVTFVPPEHVDAIGRAVFGAGAGRIGQYSSCSFRGRGTGTFFGERGTHPAVGRSESLEECSEIRFETIVPVARIAQVIRALESAHPYEEPAFDLVRLAPAPESDEGVIASENDDNVGMGRIGSIEASPVSEIIARIKSALSLPHLLVAGTVKRDVSRVAVCAGSGGDLLRDAIDARADLFVTGELRHHDALRATDAGLTVLCLLHSASERAALVPLERRLREALPGVSIARSVADREPFTMA